VWYGVEGTYTPDGIQSNQFFDDFVRRQSNVFMVHCGHFHEEYRQTSTNLFGRPVHEVLHDYQDDPNGGDGWLRLMQFDTASNRINVQSYSTTRDEYRTADESRFTLGVNFDQYRTQGGSAFFQNGINGYNGTKDTWVSQANRGTSYGNSSVIVVDDDVNNSIFSDNRGQGLLGFDGITTATNEAGKIPLGAVITSASLTLHIPDDIDNPFANPRFFIYMMTRPWDENSTWDSLQGGLTQGSDYGQLIASFAGDNNPDGDLLRLIDVSAAVQAWANGAPNYGFAIIPEIISGNDDGIEMWSSEYSVAILRPALEVNWTRTIPAPGTLGLAAGAAVLFTRRRR
jgi:hypothetical protein